MINLNGFLLKLFNFFTIIKGRQTSKLRFFNQVSDCKWKLTFQVQKNLMHLRPLLGLQALLAVDAHFLQKLSRNGKIIIIILCQLIYMKWLKRVSKKGM